MNSETTARIDNIGRMFSEMEEMSDVCGPLIKRYLLLRMNFQLAGGGWGGEKSVLNLRISEWPKQHEWFQKNGWDKIIGFNINWI